MNTREQLDALQHCFDWNSDEYESILSLIEQAESDQPTPTNPLNNYNLNPLSMAKDYISGYVNGQRKLANWILERELESIADYKWLLTKLGEIADGNEDEIL